jgi:transposase
MLRLSDAQWSEIETVLPKQSFAKGGRPRVDDKTLFEGVLWVIKNGAQWAKLPQEYGAYVTCWRRYVGWQETGLWDELWLNYLKTLSQKEQMEWVLSFMNGNFVPAKKGNGV